jgi:hypothetical protein
MTRAKFSLPAAVLLTASLLPGSAHAQFGGGGGYRREYVVRDPEQIKQQQEMEQALDPSITTPFTMTGSA